MKHVLILIIISILTAQTDRIPIKYQQRLLASSEIRFIGYDPNEVLIPKFRLNAWVEIDTLFKDYQITVETAIWAMFLRQGEGKSRYRLSAKLTHSNLLDSLVRDRTVDFIQDGSAPFLEDRQQFLFRHLKTGKYRITVTVMDLITGVSHEDEKKLVVRDKEIEPILIGDPILIETLSGQRLIDKQNIFRNRQDSLTIQFDTFNKDPKNSYLLLLRIYRKINQSRFPERALIELEKDFYSFNQSYRRFSLTLPKSHFDHYEVNFELNDQIEQKIDISAKKYEMELSDPDLDGDFVFSDTLQNSNFQINQRISSQITDISLKNLDYYAETEFMFYWDTIPNTLNEMEKFLPKLNVLLPDSISDLFDEADFDTQKTLFRRFWISQSSDQSYQDGLRELVLFKEKLNFATSNFFDFIDGLGMVRKEPFFRNGWKSEKGLLYLNHGLPDEIFGENFIEKDGTLKFLMELPVQRWVYRKNNRVYVFIGNKRL